MVWRIRLRRVCTVICGCQGVRAVVWRARLRRVCTGDLWVSGEESRGVAGQAAAGVHGDL
eukprot:281817-Chlamydomonas_euryale.AAC.6